VWAVSKASEYIQRGGDRPTLDQGGQRQCYVGVWDGTATCAIRDQVVGALLMYTPAEATQMARWILDTFADGDPR
jgi:hypothetical protein